MVAISLLPYGFAHNNIRGEEWMTGGEAVFLTGVIVAVIAFSALLAYSQITCGGLKREPTIRAIRRTVSGSGQPT
jgi:hypothetical protein